MRFLSTSSSRVILFLSILVSCKGKNSAPSKDLIAGMNLKTGAIISCGPADKQFGSVDFEMSCSSAAKKDFNLAMELLHSFEYDESEKVFAKVINESPDCAMAYWGVAMSNFHPLWNPPTEAEFQKGTKAVELAKSITNKTARETAYIDAITAFFKDWSIIQHHTRCVDFEKGMEKVYKDYPDDKEAAIFYALSLVASAELTDKTYKNQRKAGDILNALYAKYPDHPGIVHYIIHTYDYPGLATEALTAARRYASVAPSSAHALHMPSHIFTRLGLWDEDIKSNLESVASAKCYGESSGIKGHWDEELHGLDYLVYSYLQKGENDSAKSLLSYLQTIDLLNPVSSFKGGYAFAAIPSRVALENKNWTAAASLQLHPVNFPWKNFPWQEAIIRFARTMGLINSGKMDAAKSELAILNRLHDTLEKQKDAYKTKEVLIQIKTCEAWMNFKMGKTNDALQQMKLAADMEDSTGKHAVTPGEVIPARELLGDMLTLAGQYENALQGYETGLQKTPNRFNSVYGAAVAAEKAGDKEKATAYYNQLLTIVGSAKSDRAELLVAKSFLAKQ